MEFAEKYELLESLTTGAVETFISNDKLRGCRVLVHILHCDPQRPNQPTVQWVLDGFRKVAPEPAATVLEAGRYSGTLYAYVVTKMPEDAALRDWVKRYNSQLADTQETTIVGEKPTIRPDATTADLPAEKAPPLAAPPKETGHVPVQFTQMFRNFDSLAKPSAPPVSTPEPSPPTSSMPSFSSLEPPVANRPAPWDSPSPVNTERPLPNFDDPQQASGLQPAPPWQSAAPINKEPAPPRHSFPDFDDPSHPSGLQSASPWEANTPLNSAPAKKDLPKTDFSKTGLSGVSFTAEFGIRSLPASEIKPSGTEGPKAGEFTNFFQGPFRPDTPAELPPLPSRPGDSSSKAGEFTSMFRPSGSTPTETPLPTYGTTGLSGKSGSSTGLTGWFTDPDIMSRTPDATPSPSGALPPVAKEPPPAMPPLPKEPVVAAPPPPPPPPPIAATPSVFPLPTPKPAAPKPPPMSQAPSAPAGATGVFRPHGSAPVEPEMMEPEAPAGPSPYTQIINVRPRSVDSEGAGTAGPAAGSSAGSKGFGGSLPKIEPPKMDKMEKLAPPPMPKAPKAPEAPTGFKAPKAPKIDGAKFDTVPEPPVSYWPLVITLTVLVFIAVILILYFALKH